MLYKDDLMQMHGCRAGGPRNPHSMANLASYKRCPKCDFKAGNRIGSKAGGTRCPGMVKVRDAEGNIILDPDGNELVTRCTYIFISSTEAALEKRAEQASMALPMLLPTDTDSLKLLPLQKSFDNLCKKVTAAGVSCLHCERACSGMQTMRCCVVADEVNRHHF